MYTQGPLGNGGTAGGDLCDDRAIEVFAVAALGPLAFVGDGFVGGAIGVC